MSLYTFATDNFTTFADLKRRPAIDRGQVQRTLAFIVMFAVAFALAAQRQDVDTSTQSDTPASRTAVQ